MGSTPTLATMEYRQLMRDQGTIAAIKHYRIAHQCKLKEALEYINSLMPLPPLPKSKTPCPCCGTLLRTNSAKQCFICGEDWH